MVSLLLYFHFVKQMTSSTNNTLRLFHFLLFMIHLSIKVSVVSDLTREYRISWRHTDLIIITNIIFCFVLVEDMSPTPRILNIVHCSTHKTVITYMISCVKVGTTITPLHPCVNTTLSPTNFIILNNEEITIFIVTSNPFSQQRSAWQ